MYQRYGEYVARARKAATSPVLPGIYAQQPNAARMGQIGDGTTASWGAVMPASLLSPT